DGRFYITTEYAEGEDLDLILRRSGPMPVPRALGILAQLADAIDHAHSRGVIHRDLKPANLIIGQSRGQTDVLKVLDFGVAKIIAPDYAETVATTGQGEVFGTPAYMAPEQIGARGNDPRIDIYAAGCIAFELLTGDPPFIGRTLQVLNAHLTMPAPRLRSVLADVPPQLDEVIAACLEKEPERRPKTGAEIAAVVRALRAGAAAPGVGDTQSRKRSRASSSLAAHGELTIPDPQSRWVTSLDDDGGAGQDAQQDPTSLEHDLALAPVGFADRSDHRLAVDAALVALAEAVLDQGDSDFQLTVAMANLAGARGTLEAVAARMEELERSRDAVARRSQESEKRFRFAIGELRFELEQARARGSVNPDIEFQLSHLETRMAELAAQTERELKAIDDRAITLAAERAGHEEELDSLLAHLERLVDAAAPRFEDHPQIAELIARLARARAAAAAAEPGDGDLIP
ncbi:MAG TPA: protein kinase, partial [Kofleriaceae bacterium]|nr:protein kinase [Kofleriaceae bacterium]